MFFNRIRKRIWGEGDIDRNKPSKDLPNGDKEQTLPDLNGGQRASSSTSDLSTVSSATPNLNSSSKGVKVERRESARLASGASKFLRSLRSHGKDSKDQINVIALKELDSDHCLSPEGKGQLGYNTNRSSLKLPERSQSFQEKRLLVVTSKSTTESPSDHIDLNGHVKVKHSRAQSFVCNSQPSHNFLKSHLQQQQNLNQKHKGQQHHQQNIYSTPTPQNINGLPPPPPGNQQVTRNIIKPCETIYENLEVILEQNNLAKNSRLAIAIASNCSNPPTPTPVAENHVKKTETEPSSPLSSTNMTIVEKDRDRRPSRKLTKDSGYETNYSDYMNIEMLTSSVDLSKEFRSQADSSIYGSTTPTTTTGTEYLRGESFASEVTSSKSGDKERSLTTSLAGDGVNANPNTHGPTTVAKPTKDFTHFENSHSHKDANDIDQSESYKGRVAVSGVVLDGNRKLRRSISEVPSERMVFPKSQPKHVESSRAVYSSRNGLSIWNLEAQQNALSKSGSTQALYGSPSPYGIYQPLVNRAAQRSPYPTVYSTLPRNHISGSSTNEGHYQRYYQIGANTKSTPSLKHAVHDQSRVDGAKSSGSSTPIFQPVPSLSPARSTPNLGSSLGKLQIHPNPQQPAYREPPVYQPVNSLGRIYRSASSIKHPLQAKHSLNNNPPFPSGTPTKSRSSENVKLLEKVEKPPNDSVYESRKLSISSSCSSSSTSTLEPSPPSESGSTGSGSLSNSCASQNTIPSQITQCNISVSSNIKSSSPSVDKGSVSTAMSKGVGSLDNCGGSWIQDLPSNNNSSTPVRDSSSLKQIRYGPGHEKYPSWPIPAASAAEVDPVGESNSNNVIASSGSARSKSWTEQTDYPKEKVPSYARPYMKRMNQAYTQQLKTVMEKCETYNNGEKGVKSGGQRGQQNGYPGPAILPPPLGYRDIYAQNGHGYIGPGQQNQINHCTSPLSGAEKEYNIPSPPERDVKPLTQEDVEMYSKKYEEMMSQYAHSEGYHSYISSECSSYVSSGTPFLDLLRRESGELNQQFWSQDPMDPNDPLFGVGISHLAPSGRESVTTVVTNSSSNSSGTETLKWHGSASDISLASGSVGGSNNNLRMWEQQQQQQGIAHSAKVPMPQKLHPETISDSQKQIQNGIRQMKNKLESQSISKPSWTAPSSDSSSREINLKKFPLNTYTRPSSLPLEKPQAPTNQSERATKHLPEPPTTNSSPNCGLPPPTSTQASTPTSKPPSLPSTSPIIDTSKPPSVAERIWELEQKNSVSSATSSATSSPKSTNQTNTTTVTQSDKFPKSSSLSNLRETSQPLASSPSNATGTLPATSHSKKSTDTDQTGTTTSKVTTTTTTAKSTPSTSTVPSGSESSKSWNGYSSDSSSSTSATATGGVGVKSPSQTNNSTSVSRMTDSPVNNSQISYSYLDPEKKHKVADMTLKAIQKKALLSYYERHTGKSASSSSSISSSDSCGSNNNTNLSSPTSSSPPKNGSGFPDSLVQNPSNLLEKDSPFPGKSNRLTLSLPRDMDRVKESSIDLPSPGFMKSESEYVKAVGGLKQATRPSSHNICSTGSPMKNKLPHPVPGKSYEVNQVDKSENEDAGGESARMAYMSKYLPHLVKREPGSGWSGLKSPSSGGAQGSLVNNGLSSTMDPTHLPPERPPKKPHLRQQQNSEDGKETSPPPPLPRAPIRPATSSKGPVTANIVTGAPPVPSKPVVGIPVSAGVAIARSPSPELPPPPPPIAEEEVEVITNDDPLPPPPSLNEVSNCLGARSHSVSGLSSYLHKDSYLAQRKERTLGYEGRYRRTLSPSGLGSNNKSGEPASMGSGKTMSNATSTGKLDTSLTPSAWEKYHNIRPPSTTVIFTSHEIAKSPVSPTFHRSISCDSNLFNNKTGFTQSTIPPPVAQVAPLRGTADPYQYSQIGSHSSLEKMEPYHQSSSSASSASSSSQSLTFCNSPVDKLELGDAKEKSPSLNMHLSGVSELNLSSYGSNLKSTKATNGVTHHVDVQCQSQDFVPTTNGHTKSVHNSTKGPISSLPSVMVSPLQYERCENNKENIPLQNSPVKKSEVSLRVNCTSDASSQTDLSQQGRRDGEKDHLRISADGTSPDMIRSSSSSSSASRSSSTTASSCSSSFDDSSSSTKGTHMSIISSYTGRQKTQEELECEELSRHLIKHLPQGDRLQHILVPLPEHKTTADYMEGLFQLELKLKPEKQEKETNTSARSSPDLLQSLPKNEGGIQLVSETPSPVPSDKSNEDSNEDSNKKCNGHAPLPADSAYFTTSECKAKFLTQYVKDMNNSVSAISRSQDSQELNQQKEMLVSRISRKLEILRTEQLEIREEIQSNEQLGHQVVERVKLSAKRNEFDKFKLHVEEIEKITSLLLGLSGRLARAENALMSLAENSNPQEKKILESKRDKLREQLDEAKILKENIDRRSAQVSSFLQKYLTVEDYADYHHFVKMKAKLIIDAREIDDKIKLGEEQMIALKDTLSAS